MAPVREAFASGRRAVPRPAPSRGAVSASQRMEHASSLRQNRRSPSPSVRPCLVRLFVLLSLMRFVHSSIPEYACCTAASGYISVPSLGVSSLDLGPHGKPSRLFFRLPAAIACASLRSADRGPDARPRRPRYASPPKTATKMSRAQHSVQHSPRFHCPLRPCCGADCTVIFRAVPSLRAFPP